MDTVPRDQYEAMVAARDLCKQQTADVSALLEEASATIRRYQGDGVPIEDRLLTTVFAWKQANADDGGAEWMGTIDPGQAELLRDFAIDLGAAALQVLRDFARA